MNAKTQESRTNPAKVMERNKKLTEINKERMNIYKNSWMPKKINGNP